MILSQWFWTFYQTIHQAFPSLLVTEHDSLWVLFCRRPHGAPHLFVSRFSNVQDLASQWEHSVTVPTDDSQTGHGQRLGRVPLSEDQSAFRGVFATYKQHTPTWINSEERCGTWSHAAGSDKDDGGSFQKPHLHRWRHPAWGCLWSCCTSQMNTSCSAVSELWTSPSSVCSPRSHSWWPVGYKGKAFQALNLNQKPVELKLKSNDPYSSYELVRQRTLGAKVLGLQSHVFFGLWVERWILNQCVHKNPDVVLYLIAK